MADTEFFAKDWMDPDGVIVASGERLARQIIPSLRQGKSVLIHTQGIGGVSSSYFNIILQMVRDEAGEGALGRLHFQWSSPIQKGMSERSLEALRTMARP